MNTIQQAWYKFGIEDFNLYIRTNYQSTTYKMVNEDKSDALTNISI